MSYSIPGPIDEVREATIEICEALGLTNDSSPLDSINELSFNSGGECDYFWLTLTPESANGTTLTFRDTATWFTGTYYPDNLVPLLVGRFEKRSRHPTGVVKKEARLRVFLCHSSHDKAKVRDLYQQISSNGFLPWLDSEQLRPGQDWQYEIREAVRRSHVVVVCLSDSSINQEGFVQKEIVFALDAAAEKPEGVVFVVPARLEPCAVPRRLERWHWVDLFEPRGHERLLASLTSRAEQLGL